MRRHLKTLTLAGVALTASLAGVLLQSGIAMAQLGVLEIDPSLYTCTAGVCSMGTAIVGVQDSVYMSIANGTSPAPFTWSVVAGALPAGMSVESAGDAAYVQGAPAAQGTSSFTIQVVDGAGESARQAFTLTVDPNVPTHPDSVTITSAIFNTSSHKIGVVATDPNTTSTLTVSATSTGQVIGTLNSSGNGTFSKGFLVSANPGSITVTSLFGASATATVTSFTPKPRY
jgi:large repetitive protein